MKTLIVLSAMLFLITVGCKKDKENKPECRITSMTSPTGEDYVFTYNAEGKLVSTAMDGTSTINFTYNGNTVTSLYASGSYYNKTTYTINNNGQVSHSRTEYNTAGTNWAERAYEYTGAQVIKETLTKNGGFTSIRTYQWSNGNLQTMSINNNDNSWQTLTYEYYADKPYRTGDIQDWDRLMSGVEIFHSKNLLKKYTSTYQDNTTGTPIPVTEITNYSYEFDGDGKITSMTSSFGGNNQTYQYLYECK
jgi:YD repeat-containing protein